MATRAPRTNPTRPTREIRARDGFMEAVKAPIVGDFTFIDVSKVLAGLAVAALIGVPLYNYAQGDGVDTATTTVTLKTANALQAPPNTPDPNAVLFSVTGERAGSDTVTVAVVNAADLSTIQETHVTKNPATVLSVETTAPGEFTIRGWNDEGWKHDNMETAIKYKVRPGSIPTVVS